MQSRSKVFYQPTVTRYSYKPSGPVYEGVSSPFAGSEGFSVISDTFTGDRSQIHPHEFRKNILHDYVGEFNANYPDVDIRIAGYLGSNTQFESISADFNTLYNNCLSDLYDQYRSGGFGSGLDLSVDIAEARQVKLLVKQVGSISSYVRNFSPTSWARRWLTLQYGLKPLMSSAYGTFAAIMHRRQFGYQRIRGISHDVSDISRSFKDVMYPPSTITRSGTLRKRAMVVCEYRMANDVYDQLSGYTSLNPASLLWELTTGSFIVDWVYDIGGYLRNLEGALLARNSFVRGFGVNGFKCTQDLTLVGGSIVPPYTFSVSGKGFSYQSYKQRYPITSSPFPFSPSFRTDLGWKQLLSAASLLEVYRHAYRERNWHAPARKPTKVRVPGVFGSDLGLQDLDL